MSDEDRCDTIVISNGSGSCKAGIAGDDEPRVVMPSIVGRPLSQVADTGGKDCYVGSDAQSRRDVLSIKYPIEHGIITDWDDMEKIWHNVIRKLGVDEGEHSILMTEAPLNPRSHREKMTQIMFETFNVPGFFVANQGILSFYACGRTSGVIAHSGDGVTHVVPIFEGYTIPESIQRINLAGRDLTEYLMRSLDKKGHSFVTTGDREIIKEMKEQVCYTALDFEHEMCTVTSLTKKCYKLPDGHTITVDEERFKTPEVIFQPSLIGSDSLGIHQLVHNCIMKCGIDTRADLSCISLSGGNTMYPGFAERMKKEVTSLVPGNMKVRVRASDGCNMFVWIGGSILGSLSLFDNIKVTKQEYEEFGPLRTLKCI